MVLLNKQHMLFLYATADFFHFYQKGQVLFRKTNELNMLNGLNESSIFYAQLSHARHRYQAAPICRMVWHQCSAIFSASLHFRGCQVLLW